MIQPRSRPRVCSGLRRPPYPHLRPTLDALEQAEQQALIARARAKGRRTECGCISAQHGAERYDSTLNGALRTIQLDRADRAKREGMERRARQRLAARRGLRADAVSEGS